MTPKDKRCIMIFLVAFFALFSIQFPFMIHNWWFVIVVGSKTTILTHTPFTAIYYQFVSKK
jgi:hypothetical protein